MSEDENKIEELVRGIKRPIPDDPKLISHRAIWLACMICKGCQGVRDSFCREFKLSPTQDEMNILFLEMALLVTAQSLGIVRERFEKQFTKTQGDKFDDFFDSNVAVPVLKVLSNIFGKEATEIFDIYAPYEYLPIEYEEDVKNNVIVQESVKDFYKIAKNTKTKEQHFAVRIRKLFEIEEALIIHFASRFLIGLGLCLSMDAFAAVDQVDIEKLIKKLPT